MNKWSHFFWVKIIVTLFYTLPEKKQKTKKKGEGTDK